MRCHGWFLALALALLGGPASADSSATCERLRAEAHSEAVVLSGPVIEVDAAHVPDVTVIDPTSAANDGLQLRASASFSISDLLRGRAIERVADAECARTQSVEPLEHVLDTGARYGELASARAELAYLDAHRGELDRLLAEATARFESQRGTAVEVDEIRTRRNAMLLRAVDRREAIALLEELDDQHPLPELTSALATYETASLDLDRRHADQRDLQAWHVDVRGGVAGADQADWFAVVEVGYSLGGLFQGAADHRALEARRRELAHDDHELAARVAKLRGSMQRSVEALDGELAAVDAQLGEVRADRDRLADLATDSARAMRDRYTIEVMELEARRAAAVALRDARRQLVGAKP